MYKCCCPASLCGPFSFSITTALVSLRGPFSCICVVAPVLCAVRSHLAFSCMSVVPFLYAVRSHVLVLLSQFRYAVRSHLVVLLSLFLYAVRSHVLVSLPAVLYAVRSHVRQCILVPFSCRVLPCSPRTHTHTVRTYQNAPPHAPLHIRTAWTTAA
jgi:hypothetical protein